ncbi:LysR family transcriptional regulator [Paenibacillus sp. 1781tsa1]|uniref:LysR family transcriptional regulator n=1 Tax=Paenibacillus sp. 1781tsa1 TaxID=2953810 RepID=UPI00209E5A07|nr:LysR family transcriptional regulator [Paenibacillus sp. 1781tsa1]MCP1184073.1 LysR family transcriptional regulator [Paenibacillus sp. 1781tsa1]
MRMIKTFQTIVKLGSFQQAAEALQYSQPAITQHIQKLEGDLGVKLIDRGKKIKLTEAGKIFYARADQLLKEYEYLTNTISDIQQGQAGYVRIGVSEPTASHRLPAILSSFVEKNPKIRLSIRIGDSKLLNELVVDEQLDFAVCPSPETSLDTEFQPLLFEPMALLLYNTHPFAQATEIHLQDLKGQPFLFTPPNCPIRIRIEQLLAEKIDSDYQGIEISNIRSHKYYVQAKLGITIAPIATIAPAIPGTVIQPIADLKVGPIVGVLRKRNTPLGTASEKLMLDIRTALLQSNLYVPEFELPSKLAMP